MSSTDYHVRISDKHLDNFFEKLLYRFKYQKNIDRYLDLDSNWSSRVMNDGVALIPIERFDKLSRALETEPLFKLKEIGEKNKGKIKLDKETKDYLLSLRSGSHFSSILDVAPSTISKWKNREEGIEIGEEEYEKLLGDIRGGFYGVLDVECEIVDYDSFRPYGRHGKWEESIILSEVSLDRLLSADEIYPENIPVLIDKMSSMKNDEDEDSNHYNIFRKKYPELVNDLEERLTPFNSRLTIDKSRLEPKEFYRTMAPLESLNLAYKPSNQSTRRMTGNIEDYRLIEKVLHHIDSKNDQAKMSDTLKSEDDGQETDHSKSKA